MNAPRNMQACETMVQMRESGVLRGVSLGMNSNNEEHQVNFLR